MNEMSIRDIWTLRTRGTPQSIDCVKYLRSLGAGPR